MKRAPVGPHRLLLRIYLFSIGVPAVVAFVVGVFSNVFIGDPLREFHAPKLLYVADELSAHWGSDESLGAELERLARVGRHRAAVYALDGTLRASTYPGDPPPVPDDVRARLTGRHLLSLSGTCFLPSCPLVTPVMAGDRVSGYVVLEATSPLPVRPLVARLLVLGGLVLGAVLVALTLARPLERFAAAARALGAGDLSARTGIRRTDEIGHVAAAFDEMADRLGALLQSQTTLVANVAHELRTPLARIRLALELAADEDLETARGSLKEIATDLDELEHLVGDILVSARLDLEKNRAPRREGLAHRERVDLWQLVRAASARLAGRDPGRAVELRIDGAAAAVLGDAPLLRRTLENLLDNARKYSERDEPIVVECRTLDAAYEVAVVDRGIGIPPEDLPHLFTPFFRTDRSRARHTGGVGLGLSLSKKIAEAHGGGLTLENGTKKGTIARLRIPRHVEGEAPRRAGVDAA